MLTCIQTKTNVAFQHILTFYKRPPAKVLDLTYAKGHSWEKTGNERMDEIVSRYEIVKADKYIWNTPEMVIVDLKKPFTMFADESFDVVYYDPPFYFSDKVQNINEEKLLASLLTTREEVFWTTDEFEQSRKVLETEIPRILKKDGIFIIKIGDAYVKDVYFPNSFLLWESFKNSLKTMGHFMVMTQRKDCIFHMVRDNSYHYLVFKKVSENAE